MYYYSNNKDKWIVFTCWTSWRCPSPCANTCVDIQAIDTCSTVVTRWRDAIVDYCQVSDTNSFNYSYECNNEM